MNKIYLDNNSTTQVDPNVLEKMLPYFDIKFGNSSSQSHAFGWEAQAANDIAREKISQLINCSSEEIIFTSGATESINLVAHSWAKHNLSRGDHILLTQMEHHSNIVPWHIIAEDLDLHIDFIPITDNGELDLGSIDELITPKTKLVSITHQSNVLGTVNPIKSPYKLNDLGFIKVDATNKIIAIEKGRHVVDQSIIFPEGYIIEAYEGTSIQLINGASLISYSPLNFIGSEMNPIVISSDMTGSVVVLNTKQVSNIEYIEFNITYAKLTAIIEIIFGTKYIIIDLFTFDVFLQKSP